MTSGSSVAATDDFVEVPRHGCYKDKKLRVLNRPAEEVLDNIRKNGGENGWYYGTFLRKLRGYLEKIESVISFRETPATSTV